MNAPVSLIKDSLVIHHALFPSGCLSSEVLRRFSTSVEFALPCRAASIVVLTVLARLSVDSHADIL